jgi:tRNA A37 threonylcarbamoyladenosine modification protein TsaB
MAGAEPRVEQEEVAVSLESWLERIGARSCTFVGDAVELVRPQARPQWTLLPFDRFHPHGGIVAKLGMERLERGDGDDLAALEPFYVRPSEAERKCS